MVHAWYKPDMSRFEARGLGRDRLCLAGVNGGILTPSRDSHGVFAGYGGSGLPGVSGS
jgi:hypothetical protein